MLLLLLAVLFIGSHTRQLSFPLAKNEKFCFYEPYVKEEVIHCEFIVTGGGQKNINFSIIKPNGNVLLTKYARFIHPEENGDVKTKSEEEGDYAFCFDNYFSNSESKHITFTTHEHIRKNKEKNNLADSSKMTGLVATLITILGELEELEHHQKFISEYARSYHEHALFMDNRIYCWNIAETCILLCLSLYMTYTIRNWFNKSKRNKINI